MEALVIFAVMVAIGWSLYKIDRWLKPRQQNWAREREIREAEFLIRQGERDADIMHEAWGRLHGDGRRQ
ncbi:hypothetical protein [Rhodococcus aetherivorans]|uniref:hypothetical protein n=1 Tax=Rhodococcus aetherivorans TaxID=191292 RepID=UPI00388EF20E